MLGNSGLKSLKSEWIRKITTQQAKASKVNKVRCILLKIRASIYLLESFTGIPIQIQMTAAGLAQSVECLTAEREVGGSIPGAGPILRVLKITEK